MVNKDEYSVQTSFHLVKLISSVLALAMKALVNDLR